MSESATTVDVGVPSDKPSNVISRNPNASVALSSGAGLGSLIVWSVGLTGAAITPEAAAALGGVLAALFLLIGREGIRGLLGTAWRGSASHD
jgi:hypothetical protein